MQFRTILACRIRTSGVLCVFLIVWIAGCAGKYTVRSANPTESMQWPFQPEEARITYLQALYGFERSNSSSKSVLRAIAGSPEQGEDQFVLPVAIAIGGDGRIAVADRALKSIHLYIPEIARYLRIPGKEGPRLESPVSVMFDEDLRLYVSDSTGKVLVYGSNGSFIDVWKSAGDEALQRPTGIAYSPTSHLLYVADTLRNEVIAFNKDGSHAFSFGQRGSESGQFNFPTYVYHSPQTGTLYVSDSLNFRIQMFDETGKFLGLFGNHGDGSGDLAMPKGVASDKAGVVYVADSLFDNVQLFTGRGEFLLTLGRRGSKFGEFWLPAGIYIDDSNKLYVCDSYNRRIQVFQITEQKS